MNKTIFRGVFIGLCLSAVASAQNGANDCASAVPISGLGIFNFDNTAATTDGPSDCGGQPVRRDLWYLWTCPGTNGYSVSTCSQTTLGTRIAVYDGFDCATFPLLACEAWNCATQTNLVFNAIGGNQYLIRLGSRATGAGATGTFTIATDFCVTGPTDPFDPNGDCSTATTLTDGSWTGLVVSMAEPDYYQFTVPANGSIQMDWIFNHAAGDVDIFMYDDCGVNTIAQSTSGDNDEQIIWINPDPCDKLISVRTEIWSGSNSPCNVYDMILTGTGSTGNPCGGGGGVVYACDPANSNSTGVDCKLAVTGTFASADAYPIHIEATTGPASQFGYFLVAGTLNDPGVNVSAGRLCLGAPMARYSPATGAANQDFNSIGQFNASGIFMSLSGNSTVGSGFDVPNVLPDPINQALAPGMTWTFQLWYRDGAVSNFSTAAQVTFN